MSSNPTRVPRFACLVLLASACAAPEPSSRPSPPAVAMRVDLVRALLEVRAPSNPVRGARGELYVRDWPDGVNQVWRLEPDGARTRLTSFTDGASSFLLSPDGARLLVSAANGGNEEDQVWLLGATRTNAASSAPEPLLTRPRTVFKPQLWLRGSSSFLYVANDMSPEDFHLYRFDFEAPGSSRGASTKLSSAPGSWSAQDATAGAERVLCTRFVSESEAYAYELDARTGALAPIGPRPERGETCHTASLGYLPGERAALVESDALDGKKRVWMHDLETKRATRPLARLERYEVDETRLSDEHDLLAIVSNEGGYGVLHVFRLPGFEEVELPAMERGVVTLSDLRGGKLLFTLANAHTPGIAFELALPAEGRAVLRPVTTAATGSVDLASLRAPELVAYRSFDGLEVPAFLYVPATRRADERIPFVVHFHGGPEGQHRPGFDRTVQALVAEGFGVLQPNVRGSTGYGRDYHRLDDREKRWNSVQDGVAAARWLVEQGYAEEGRIAAYGASYGGFMSVATVIEGEGLFGAGVDVVGIVNFETFLEQTAGYRRALREAEYGSLDDRGFLRSISPLLRADEIPCPMLIAHGLNDPRVPVGEAMQLATALQRRGEDPEQLYFTDEGHGFQKLENRALFTERMLRFLARTIGR
ncbi:MAG: S9 family peptidase [Planctomycetes bacterium]|nr:S9 family peptidase [Planctomycetota bacterium]